MPTKRELILTTVETQVNTVGTLNTVTIKRTLETDKETLALPAAFIYPGSSSRVNDAPIGQEGFDWEVVVQCWAQETNMEQLLADIHAAVQADTTLGGLVEWIYITGTEIFYVDGDELLQGIQITFTTRYEHDEGSP